MVNTGMGILIIPVQWKKRDGWGSKGPPPTTFAAEWKVRWWSSLCCIALTLRLTHNAAPNYTKCFQMFKSYLEQVTPKLLRLKIFVWNGLPSHTNSNTRPNWRLPVENWLMTGNIRQDSTCTEQRNWAVKVVKIELALQRPLLKG